MLDQKMLAKAKWVADLMLADGVSPKHVDEELCLAYMDAIARKIDVMQAMYLTNSSFKNNLQDFVLVAQ